MDKKKKNTLTRSVRSANCRHRLLRDAGKTLKLKTGLRAGAIKMTDILVS